MEDKLSEIIPVLLTTSGMSGAWFYGGWLAYDKGMDMTPFILGTFLPMGFPIMATIAGAITLCVLLVDRWKINPLIKAYTNGE